MTPSTFPHFVLSLSYVFTTCYADSSDEASTISLLFSGSSRWVDVAFVVFILCHHSYYAYKFTDYSLSHVHSAAETQAREDRVKTEKRKIKEEILGARKKTQSSRTLKKQASKAMLAASSFSTASSSMTQRRHHNTLCCCFHCAPRFLTWKRTGTLRLCLRLCYVSICLSKVARRIVCPSHS